MYNTAKELHIGIDLGLQGINSNRKGDIQSPEKDWFLNNVMIQEINRKLNPKSNFKGEGFEDTFKRIDDLESIKEDTSEIVSLPIYKYSDKASYIPLPSDYYRFIEGVVSVNNMGTIGSSVVLFKDLIVTNGLPYVTVFGALKLPSATSNYSDFIIRFMYDITGPYGSEVYDEEILFDINEEGHYWSYTSDPTDIYYLHGMEAINVTYSDAKFQLIRMVMDHINNVTGVEIGLTVYWERYVNIYEKDSFIFVVDNAILTERIPNYDPISNPLYNKIYLSPTGDEPNTPGDEDTYCQLLHIYTNKTNEYIQKFEPSALGDINIYTAAETAAYAAAIFDVYPIRMVKSSELHTLNKHYYGKTVFDSPIGIIRQGRIVVYHDSTFEFNRIDLEYYRKPRLISLPNNQGCEITSDSFRVELVDKTVQKISAFIQDPNYKNVLQENLILE